MTKHDWLVHYRRARCGLQRRTDFRAVLARINRTSHWEACAALRAHWLNRDTMRAHKLTLIEDCRRALWAIKPNLP